MTGDPLDRIEERAKRKIAEATEALGDDYIAAGFFSAPDVLALVQVARAARDFVEDEANYERLVAALARLEGTPE
jgi:glutathione S-transferase